MKKLLCIAVAIALLNGCAGKKHGIDLANMDLTADPAQDFYQFANGGWLEKNSIPESESRWGAIHEIRDANKEALRGLLKEVSKSDHPEGTNAQKVGDFYRTGMNLDQIEENGLTPLQSYFDEIASMETKEDLLSLLAKHHRMGSGALFTVFAEGDFMNSNINSAYAYQAGLGMPDRDYYLESSEKFETYRTEYLIHLRKMFELMGQDSVQALESAKTIFDIETELAKSSWTRQELRNLTKWYNKYTFQQANKYTPHLDWNRHFKAIGVQDIDFFLIVQPKFFKKVDALLSTVPMADWKVYIQWHLVNALAPFLNDAIVNQNFAFYQGVLRGTKELKPRWKRVAETTDGALGEALGQLYVEKHFPPEAKSKANEIVTNLRVAYRKRIEKLDWMSEETKSQAFAKLENLVQKIGYPDKWRDYSALEIKRDAYVLNVIRANEFEFNRNMKKIGNPVDKTEWGMTPPTVNAYFHPLNNEIVFPAGILQPPFFDPQADDAVNYGAMGVVIGHEITHGYDDQGRNFDANGNMNNWWTDKDKSLFDEKTKVIEEQFSAYTVLDSVPINGKLTLGENIADLGGLAVAYDAMEISMEKNGRPELIDGFTPEQRFFISYGSVWRNLVRDDALLNQVKTDPHTPAYYRVLGPLSNTPAFFEAFDIQPGDAMRRPDDMLAKVW